MSRWLERVSRVKRGRRDDLPGPSYVGYHDYPEAGPKRPDAQVPITWFDHTMRGLAVRVLTETIAMMSRLRAAIDPPTKAVHPPRPDGHPSQRLPGVDVHP